MKQLFFISVPSIIIVIIVFLVVQLLILPRNAKGALQITANPVSKVIIDGKYIGTTPMCRCDGQNMLSVGDHTLRLSAVNGKLPDYQETIHIEKSVLTVVDRKLGTEGTSEGSVISLTPLEAGNDTQLLVTSIPDKTDVYVDNNPVGQTPLLLKQITQSDHTLKIKKDGYNEKIIRIRSPKGYKLLATVTLSLSSDSINISDTPTPPLLTLTPSPTSTPKSQSSVTILQTPNGFLRVREEASVQSNEIGRVVEGQVFNVLEESSGWYKIELADGKIGWISSDYAQKK